MCLHLGLILVNFNVFKMLQQSDTCIFYISFHRLLCRICGIWASTFGCFGLSAVWSSVEPPASDTCPLVWSVQNQKTDVVMGFMDWSDGLKHNQQINQKWSFFVAALKTVTSSLVFYYTYFFFSFHIFQPKYQIRTFWLVFNFSINFMLWVLFYF